jgi:hypothetical protein
MKIQRHYRRDRVERAETTPEWQQEQKRTLALKEQKARLERWSEGKFLGAQDSVLPTVRSCDIKS